MRARFAAWAAQACLFGLWLAPCPVHAGPYEDELGDALADALTMRDERAIVPLLRVFQIWDRTDPDRVEEAIGAIEIAPRLPPSVRAYARYLHAAVRLRRADVAGGRAHIEALGLVRDWLVIGPFENEGKSGLERQDPPESTQREPIELSRGYPGREREVFWRTAPAEAASFGTLNLDALLRPNVNVCGFAQTFVTSDREQRVTLLAGGGGGIKVYLNGEVVLTDTAYRSADLDRGAATVTLGRGTNRVLVKSCAAEGQWALSLRFAGADGLAAPGVSFSADVARSADPLGPAPRPEPRDWILSALTRRASGTRPSAAALVDLARYLRWTGGDDPDERRARQLALRAVEIDAGVEALLFAAEVAEDRNERGRLLQRAQEVLRAPSPKLLIAISAFRRAGPRTEEALPYATRALAADPGFYEARLERAAVYAEVGLPLLALREIREAMAHEPVATPLLLRSAGDMADAAGLPDEALAHRRDYLRIRADDAGALRAVASELIARRDSTGARRVIDLLLAVRADSLQSYSYGADALEALGDLEAADATHRRLSALVPDDAVALSAYGRFCARHRRSTEAVSLLRRALALRPQDAELREYLEHLEPTERPETAFVADAERLKAGPRQPGSDGYAARTLQDLTVNTVYDNGLGSSFRQVVIEVLTEEGARRYQQYSIQYDPSGQRVDVRLARVLRRRGGTDQAVQRYDQSLSEPWYSLYYDLRADMVVFPRLEVGDVVELQYRVDDVSHRNLFADYYGDITFLQGSEPRQAVRYVLDTPAARSFYFREPQLPGLAKDVTRSGQRRVYSFSATNVPAVVSEEQMPGFAEVAAYVHVSTYRGWDDVGRWYWGLVRDQFQADDALKATVRRLVDGITDPRARARAIYGWVVQNTRYVALEFGIHGFKPYRTSQVVSRGFGDCKDKATLLVVMLQEAGVPASIVLVRTRRNGSIAPYPASLAVFDHAIAYVPSLDLFLDGTAEQSGSTELPAQDQGVTVLVVNEGRPVLTRTPVFGAEHNRRERVLDVRLAADGSAVVRSQESISGSAAAGFRDRYQAEGTREERVEMAINSVYPGANVESHEFSSLGNLESPVHFSFRARVPQFARIEGGALSLPVATATELTRTLARVSARQQDMDLGVPWELDEEVTTVLPTGLRPAHVPSSARLETEFGLLDLRIENRGRELWVRKRLVLRRDRVSRAEYGRFREFCRAVDEALGERVRLERE